MDIISDYIRHSFCYSFGIGPIVYNKNSDFISKDCFQYLLHVDISEDVFEVPVILKNVVSSARINGCSEIYIPVANNNRVPIINRKTVRPILKDFLNSTYQDVQAIITSKGEKYYGCPGLILDSDGNPLFVATCKLSGGKVIEYRCRISSNIYTNRNNLLEKAIFNKFLPALSIEYAGYNPKFTGVFIGDINLVVKPVVPTFNSDINEDINKFLADNIEEIL